jgi:hypothetical protein
MLRNWKSTLLNTLFITALILTCHDAFAQRGSAGDAGLAASIQGEQLDVAMPIWVSNSVVLAPAVGLVLAEDMGTSISLAAMGRFYFREGIARPYAGLRLGAFLTSPEEGESTTDILAGPMLGGEVFLQENFSVGVEAQLNFIFSDDMSLRFGNPGKMNISTGSAVMATFYF